MVQRRHAVHEHAAAHQEHGGRARNGQPLHEPGRGGDDAPAQRAGRGAGTLAQPQSQVIELDDAGHQAIDAQGHDEGNARQHGDLLPERRRGHGAQGNGDDLGREDEVGAHGTLDLVLFHGDEIDARIGIGLGEALALHGIFLGRMQEFVGQLLATLKAQKGAADHEQRRDSPGNEGADEQRRRHEDDLVDQRALGHGPDNGNLALGAHARDLLGVKGQVIAQHAGRLLRSHLGHDGHIVGHGHALAGRDLGHEGHVVKDRCNIVKQHQQTSTSHRVSPVNCWGALRPGRHHGARACPARVGEARRPAGPPA